MAAIDKIYLSSYEEFCEFKNWCEKQPKLKDKYDNEVSILDYFYDFWDSPKYWEEEEKCHPVFCAPYYVDAYLIKNCPLEYVQKELMLNYGYWSQERIKRYYEDVKNWNGDGECPYWAKLEDFITLEDGTMTIKGLEKSDYEKIKDGELYNSPTLEGKYEAGTHFKITKLPFYRVKCKYPMRYRSKSGLRIQPLWDVSIETPGDCESMWWHDRGKIGTWDFSSEFVTDHNWSSSSTWCPSLKSIKRRILKWKLPIGTIVRLQGRYVGEEYEIVIKK